MIKNSTTTPRETKIIVIEHGQNIGQVLNELNDPTENSSDGKKFSDMIKVFIF